MASANRDGEAESKLKSNADRKSEDDSPQLSDDNGGDDGGTETAASASDENGGDDGGTETAASASDENGGDDGDTETAASAADDNYDTEAASVVTDSEATKDSASGDEDDDNYGDDDDGEVSASAVTYWHFLADYGKWQCAIEDARREAEKLKDLMQRAQMEGKVHIKCHNCPCRQCDINRQCFSYNGPHGGWKVIGLATYTPNLEGSTSRNVALAHGKLVCPISQFSHYAKCRELTVGEYNQKCTKRDVMPINPACKDTQSTQSDLKQIRQVQLGVAIMPDYREPTEYDYL
jgi:hypothetical protein